MLPCSHRSDQVFGRNLVRSDNHGPPLVSRTLAPVFRHCVRPNDVSLASRLMPEPNKTSLSTSSFSKPLTTKASLPWRRQMTQSMTSSRTARARASRPCRGAGTPEPAVFGDLQLCLPACPAAWLAKDASDDAEPNLMDEKGIAADKLRHAGP